MTGLNDIIIFQGGTWEISTHKRDLTELSALLYENSFALDLNGFSVTRDRGHVIKLVCLQFLLLPLSLFFLLAYSYPCILFLFLFSLLPSAVSRSF